MMRLLARLYYKDPEEEDAEFEPDVEWQETDDGKALIGEVCHGMEFGEGTVETLPKRELIENLAHYAKGPDVRLEVYDDELAKKLERQGVKFEKKEAPED